MVFGWFKKLTSGLSKSSEKISDGIKKVIKGKKIDETTLGELEEFLISSDLGVNFSSEIIEDLRKSKIIEPNSEKVRSIIQKKVENLLQPLEQKIYVKTKPFIFLVVGINGVGKTATVGKLAYKYISAKKKVGLVAADTFRAAATEQLKVWSDRTGSEFFSANEYSDPAALSFESVQEAKKQNLDVLIIDTAGRLHNKSDLMDQLKKTIRVIKKIDDSFPNQIVLVLDGNIGQNSIRQAEVFKEICEIDSLIITKLDGTAKGGVIVPIAELLKIPILAVGIGEKKEDLIDFNAKDFSKALLGLD